MAARLWADRWAWLLVGVTVPAYLLLYLVALGDLSFDGRMRPFEASVMAMAGELWTRARTPFQFEAIAVVQAPIAIWIVSPLNAAIGLTLGILAGLQLACVRIAWRCARSCGVGPAAGALGALPGLLAGSACCAPALFLLLGLQATAGAIAVMGVMIPLAFVLLTAGVALTWHYAARRCREAHA